MELNKGLECEPVIASMQLATTFWRRAVWMQLGALNGLAALFILLVTDAAMLSAGHAASIRLGAQVQFMHGMATLACATFMNIGANGARIAPAFFLSGILLYCLPIYAEVIGIAGWLALMKPVGLGAFTAGWIIMVWSAREIDKS